jgi:putative molybdopterin biosynthesis protein
MQRYTDITQDLARRITTGAPAPGMPLPAIRALAARYGVAPATVGRALGELARAGVVVTRARQHATVAPDGAHRAARLLHGGQVLRVAGSDDPALARLLAAAGGGVEPVHARGSMSGLTALWQRTADAATLHLQHADGTYNDPFAARMLAGRAPVLVRLWRREQGIVCRPADADAIRGLGDLPGRVVALRPPGTGTRVLLERLLRHQGLDPAAISGPTAATHLDVALTVAAGAADAGVAVRSAATVLHLHFVPLTWEPFDLALPADALSAADPLRTALTDPTVQADLLRLGGYDLEESGALRPAE